MDEMKTSCSKWWDYRFRLPARVEEVGRGLQGQLQIAFESALLVGLPILLSALPTPLACKA